MVPVVALIAIGLLFAAAGRKVGSNMTKTTKPVLSPDLVKLAERWAGTRGVPTDWVLATILLESAGNPKAIGDQGRSYGLMQINTQAQAKRLAQMGIAKDQLFDPSTNIQVGTLIMREALDWLTNKLKGKTPPRPMDELVRLAYKGGLGTAQKALGGADPYPAAIIAWQDRRRRVAPLCA